MNRSVDAEKIFARCFAGCETLAWALSQKLSEGSICLDVREYREALPGLLEEQKRKDTFREEDALFWSAQDFAKQCEEGEYVTHSGSVLKPFVIWDGQAYLHRYFTYETHIINSIRRLGANFHIITGGPGTGKTYGVSATLAGLFGRNPGLKVGLAAPTGKAAARMNESVRNFAEDPGNGLGAEVKNKLAALKAETIHRFLGYVQGSVFFRHHENNRLPFDVVIIDECSMIDGAMMAKLLSAVDDKTMLYLLGDRDQLASVEAGSVFGDICRAGETPLLKGRVEVKTKSWRFDPGKGIGRFSREVIMGKFDDPGSYAGDGQLNIDPAFSQELFENYAMIYREYIEEPDIKKALQKLNQVRFLCAMRENDQSVSKVNRQIMYLLSRRVPGFKPVPEGFYHNQPVMVTRNDYQLNIFNGDVGIIRRVAADGREALIAHFESSDGGVRTLQAGYLNHYETVFAMTIHKSQGSEFENVVVILPEKQGEKLLTRELLYTAVTRARSKVLLQASAPVLQRCVGKVVARASGLEKRLAGIKI
ncbi:MAG: exodeoxyribonuclease V subunit alpha [Bacteroidota bacterium]